MYCPRCGTQAASSQARFCSECGGEITEPAGRPSEQGARPAGQDTGAGPSQRAWRDNSPDSPLRVVLMAAGLVVLVPLMLIAGLAVLGVAIHALPLIALCLVVYWVLSRRQRWSRVRL